MKYLFFFIAILCIPPIAHADQYRLEIAEKLVQVSGHEVKKIAINGTIPGPTLNFTEDEDVAIAVTNKLNRPTSIHWHGLLVPGTMDGVPGLNGFPGIAPGETFVYRFKIRQSGTYWYHSHSLGQEGDGLYGPIVIKPKEKDPITAERDYVVLLSDISPENSREILSNLKMDSSYYNYAQRTIGDFISMAAKDGFGRAWSDVSEWAKMRMSPSDLSDVSGYTFLINGKSPEENWTALFKKGERVRLRFINASAMTFFDVRIPGLKMEVVQADGQNVEPIKVDEFRFGIAETYDVIVQPDYDKTYAIVAEPIDRTGFALGTLATKAGTRIEPPAHRKRATLTMADMAMGGEMAGMDHGMAAMHGMQSGWANAGTPDGDRALRYEDLRFVNKQSDLRGPSREITMHLGGNMERYIWTLNGKRHQEAEPIRITYGERVRITFVNDSMMAHPMHLHGMFVQLENGQPVEKLPNKHTIIIPPAQSRSVLLSATEMGEWSFHCHLLYHMLSGMMTTAIVERVDPSKPATQSESRHEHTH